MREYEEIIICPVCKKGELECIGINEFIPADADDNPAFIYCCSNCLREFLHNE